MNREQFQKIVDKITGGEYYPPKRKNPKLATISKGGHRGPTIKLKVEWMSGGAWGGNCWDDSDPGSYCPTPDDEPEMVELDQILQQVAPTIGFLQYKQLLQKVKRDHRIEHEYYGNHTSYTSKEISIDDIWDFLQETGYVQ